MIVMKVTERDRMTMIMTREATCVNNNDCSHKDKNINISDMNIPYI